MKREATLKKKIIEFIKDILIPVAIAFFITHFICFIAVVPTASMKPFINENDHLIVNKVEKHFGTIERGELLVFNAPPDISGEKKLLIKRVIGLPGETVEIKEGIVYINDTPLNEDYVVYKDTKNMEKINIPENEYFLLGDNRSNSFDCRFWNKKTINEKDVVGIAHTFDSIKRIFININ